MPYPAKSKEYKVRSSGKITANNRKMFDSPKVKLALARKGIAKWDQLEHNKDLGVISVVKSFEINRENELEVADMLGMSKSAVTLKRYHYIWVVE